MSRYGWNISYVMSLPWKRFSMLSDMAEEIKKSEAKDRMVIAAFIGWQMGAGGKKSFSRYLKSLGLDLKEKVKTSKQEIARAKEYALKRAKNIIDFDKKRKEKLKRI